MAGRTAGMWSKESNSSFVACYIARITQISYQIKAENITWFLSLYIFLELTQKLEILSK